MPRIKVTPTGKSSGARKEKSKKTVKPTGRKNKNKGRPKGGKKRAEHESNPAVSSLSEDGDRTPPKKLDNSLSSGSTVSGSNSDGSVRVRSKAAKKRKRSGELEEGQRKRGRVKEVRISNTTVAKWKPVSEAARKLMSDTMVSALG